MEITAEERDALRDQVLSHLEALDDLTMALKAGEFQTAERLAIEFGDELRLMQDLGWAGIPSREGIELTMPSTQLRRLFTRLRSDAESLRASEEREEAEERRNAKAQGARVRHVEAACQRVLLVTGESSPRADDP